MSDLNWDRIFMDINKVLFDPIVNKKKKNPVSLEHTQIYQEPVNTV